MGISKTSFLYLFLVTLLSMTVLSTSSDMSIIDYDAKHGMGRPRDDQEVKAIYEKWLVRHGKFYNGLGEKEKRLEIFKDNLRFIEEHNIDEKRSYRVGLNKFADLSNEEYRLMHLGVKMERGKRVGGKVKSDRYRVGEGGEELPESVDWRENGAVAPVKDQGSCGKKFDF